MARHRELSEPRRLSSLCPLFVSSSSWTLVKIGWPGRGTLARIDDPQLSGFSARPFSSAG
jgi:hypothetical protein